MGSFIARQPNGLYCRFSSVVDTVTNYNMTVNDYINEVLIFKYGYSEDKAKLEADDIIKNHLRPFSDVVERFIPNNQNLEEFNLLLEEMGYKFNQ